MPEIVADCPRCGAKKHTFVAKTFVPTYTSYNWQRHYEPYCVCKNCLRGTIFTIAQKNIEDGDDFRRKDFLASFDGSLNQILTVTGFVSLRDNSAQKPPADTPEIIEKIFREGAESVAGNCPNAASAMFRLCLDITSKSLLPDDEAEGLTKEVRGKLWKRLDWLFTHGHLPLDIQPLADSIRLDGNDAAHDGTLNMDDANDLLDFTMLFLERVFTEPARVEEAKRRRELRRQK